MNSKSKILVIDDETLVVRPVLDWLEFKFGSDSFIYAQYFDQGWQILKTENISCLSLDLIMPSSNILKYDISRANGLNALKQIREDYPTLPIVCYTILGGDDAYNTITQYKAIYIEKNKENSFYKLMEFFSKNHKR